jgi:DNA-binding PadR family transcriptional regulator
MFGQCGPHGRRGPRGGFGPWARGFGRFHHGWGSGGPWGGTFGRGVGPAKGGRRFGRGDLKYVILDLLQEQPRHGYDIIRAIEERFQGFYSPSAGSVYPTLQLLEDQGYVTSTEQDGKRVYTITDEGRRFLAERAEAIEGIRNRMPGGWGQPLNPEVRQVMQELWQIGQFLFRQGAHGELSNPEKVRQLREVVSRARVEIEAIFGQGSGSRETMV